MTRLCILAETIEQADSLCAALKPLWPDAAFNSEITDDTNHVIILGNTAAPDTSATLWRVQMANENATADHIIHAPIRLASLMQKIKEQVAQYKILQLGDYSLDEGQRRWNAPDGSIIDLTEKEVALLSYLAAQHPTPATRDDLLREVWKYADGADTHTIETHLYRLRQKIEQNPSDPTIVVSTKQGYILGIL